jgi:hypothetical protein
MAPKYIDYQMAVSRAAFNERLHQQDCRARAAGRECQTCLDFEVEWLAADDALNAYLDRVEVAAS